MKLQIRYILLVVALCVFSSSLAIAASVTVTSSGSGTFVVQGDRMDGVSGIDLTIGYDASTLSSPTIKWGSLVSGATPIVNPTNPIRIAIIRPNPFSGSGPIATISFSTQGSGGGLTYILAKVIDSNGKYVLVQASIDPSAASTTTAAADPGLIKNPGVPFSPPAAPGVSTPAPVTPAPTAPTGPGYVNIQGDQQSKTDMQHVESEAVHPDESSDKAEHAAQQMNQTPAEKNAEPVESADVKKTVYQSVLDRFRTYQGERTPEILMALFSKTVSSYIRQEPAIAVSDGKAPLRVTVDLAAVKGGSNNFALAGAKMVSLKKVDNSDTWFLDILPQVNSQKGSVTILNSTSEIEYPLTIVPPSGEVSTKLSDFAEFLKDSGSKTPKYDLNGDGRHDYQDDYIYTAHYLINLRAAADTAK